MSEVGIKQNKGFISQSVEKYKKFQGFNWNKIVLLFYIGFTLIIVLVLLQPEKGTKTIIHSNRYDCDIIYNRGLTRDELPEYDPVVWEKDHIKSQDFTISYVDTGSWSYARYGLSSLHLAAIFFAPIVIFGLSQFMFGLSPERDVMRIVDESDRPMFTKRSGIRERKGYVEIDIYDARKVPRFIPFLSGIWWLGKKRYTVYSFPTLVTRKETMNLVIIQGIIIGEYVRVTQSKANKMLPELVAELNHYLDMNETKEGLLTGTYGYIAETEANMMDIVRNMAKALKLAKDDEKTLEDKIEKVWLRLERGKAKHHNE